MKQHRNTEHRDQERHVLPDNFDYDTSYNKLELCDIGLLVISFLFK